MAEQFHQPQIQKPGPAEIINQKEPNRSPSQRRAPFLHRTDRALVGQHVLNQSVSLFLNAIGTAIRKNRELEIKVERFPHRRQNHATRGHPRKHQLRDIIRAQISGIDHGRF